MRAFVFFFSLMNLHAFAAENQKEARQEERNYSPDDEKNERTYSAPIEREDEYRQEMEIDEERDRDEARAKFNGEAPTP